MWKKVKQDSGCRVGDTVVILNREIGKFEGGKVGEQVDVQGKRI